MSSMATASSRFEVVSTLKVHGHAGVLLRETFSGDWVASVDVDERVCTVRGKDRSQVESGICTAVMNLVTGRALRTVAA
jgi:hypothetical protein